MMTEAIDPQALLDRRAPWRAAAVARPPGGVIVGIDRSTGIDAGVEQVEEKKLVDPHPPSPPDRPGQEPEGVPSRLEARRAMAAATEQAAEKPAEATNKKMPKSTSEQGSVSDAGTEQQPPERTDKPHEVKPPQIVGDYYTNIPRTAQERYLVRDQSNPMPVFDGSPTRDQVTQGVVGDCGIVAALGAVAEHRPNAVKDAIKQAGDGEYEITLHEITESTHADPVARPTGDVKAYRVNDELPVNTDRAARPLAGIRAESCGWPALMEKVIAAEDQPRTFSS